ncbi:MAG: hypothetical protein LBK72_08400, partial [Bifidobacteriaceae bacterium]|nr:hypothetical protein [Bifidobacteriaceae bacterium]
HPDDLNPTTARTVLAGVLANTGTEPSAHTAAAGEHEQWGSIRQLCAERDIILAAALADHWATLIRSSDLTPGQAEQVIASDAFRPLSGELRRAHTNGQPPDAFLRAAIHAGRLDNPSGPASTLYRRIGTLNDHTLAESPHHPVRMIAGIIPDIDIPIAPEIRHILDQYNTAITHRARRLAQQSIQQGEPWLQALGPHPTAHADTQRWEQAAIALAAYRELHHITDPNPYRTPTPGETPNGDPAHVRALVDGLRSPVSISPNTPPPPRPVQVL